MRALYEIVDPQDGRLRLYLHPGQQRAWESDARFVFIIAGTQSGKTSFGPWWLLREIQRKGPGDYLAVTSTFDLFKLKMLPEMRKVFCNIIGDYEYKAGERVIISNDGETRIILRSAHAEAALESATAKAAWLDECGQLEFGPGAWEAVLRRLSLSQGRVLGTTTPYSINSWLKTQVFDRWRQGDRNYDVIQFESVLNPAFPREEFERARQTLPEWKFAMFYRGQFQRPQGLVYPAFSAEHIVHRDKREFIYWLLAIDEGYTNPAVILTVGVDQDGRLHVYEEFYKTGQLQSKVVEYARWKMLEYNVSRAIVDESAAGLIADLRNAGVAAEGHKGRVLDSIQIVSQLLAKQGDGKPRLTVEPTCVNTIMEFESYSWREGKDEPLKENDHAMDALRYLCHWLFGDEVVLTRVVYSNPFVR